MSFSSEIKAELAKAPIGKHNAAVCELLGVALFCNTFRGDLLRIVTENEDFAARLPRLLHKAFSLDFDRVPEEAQTGGKYVFELFSRAKLDVVLQAFGFSAGGDVMLHLNYNVLEDETCAVAFLRGMFLAGGSATDPEKRYHLEISTNHHSVGRETHALMLDLGLDPKEMDRSGNFVLYFKQSDSIETFLTVMGCPVSAMTIMSAKAEKELVNGVNRRVNCETANLTKAVEAAHDQLEAIRRLEESDRLAALPEKLREAAILRRDNPEATLTELSELISPPVSKSAMNHRMRKLVELSKE